MLSIRDPRASALAKELASKRKTTMTDAIVTALENELRRECDKIPLVERVDAITRRLASQAGPNGRKMTKDEIDDMWGH
jgi:antitoxin VapB